MSALWIHFRRLAASLMLAAMTSLVLHGASLAGFHQHQLGSAECAGTASSGHLHQAAAPAASKHGHAAGHDHGGASHHQAALDLTDDPAPSDKQTGGQAGSQCCASLCAFALVAFGPDALSVPVSMVQARVPDSQVGAGIDLGGLKRPPRTPCIA